MPILLMLRTGILLCIYFLHPSYAQNSSTLQAHPFLNISEERWIKEHPVIHACVENDWAPFSYKDVNGHLVGLSTEYLDILAKLIGIEIEYHSNYTWQEILEKTKQGECDLLNGLYFSEERNQFLHYTNSYITLNEYFFTRDTDKTIYSMKQLHNKTLALVKGYATTQWIKKHYPTLKVIEKKTIEECLYSVLSKESDVFIGDYPSTLYNLEENLITGIKLNNNYKDMDPRKLYMAVKETYQPLATILTKALMAMSEEEKQALKLKWMNISNKKMIYLTKKERKWLATHPKINYGYDPNWKPFEWKDDLNKHQGILSDIIQILSERSGIQFIDTPTQTWTDALSKIKSGKVAMLTGIGKNMKRDKYLIFSNKTLYHVPYVFVSKYNHPPITHIESIRNEHIGIIKDYTISPILYQSYPKLHFYESNNADELFEQLNKNKINTLIVNEVTARYYIDFAGYKNMKVISKTPFKLDIQFAFNANTPQEAITIINKTLQTFTEEELEMIFKKWTTGTIQKETNWEFVWYIFIVALLIVFFLFLINRRLRYMVGKKTIELQEINNHLEDLVTQRTKKLEKLNKKLSYFAHMDSMTGIYNRRYFFDISKKLLDIHIENNTPMSIAMIDIDFFKKVNDTYGHDIGDEVIIHIVKSIKTMIREEDILIRFGGEEFLLIFPNTSQYQAKIICERIRKFIDNNNPLEDIHTTVSIGLTILNSNDKNINVPIKRADTALYQAKKSGRNKIISD